MRDLARHPHFGVELRQPRRIAVDVRRQELQRDRLAELQVVGAVDLAHAAAAEPPDDAVASAEERAGLEAAVVDRAGRGEPAGRATKDESLWRESCRRSWLAERVPPGASRVASSMPGRSCGITVSIADCGSGVRHFGQNSPASCGTMTAAQLGQERCSPRQSSSRPKSGCPLREA